MVFEVFWGSYPMILLDFTYLRVGVIVLGDLRTHLQQAQALPTRHLPHVPVGQVEDLARGFHWSAIGYRASRVYMIDEPFALPAEVAYEPLWCHVSEDGI